MNISKELVLPQKSVTSKFCAQDFKLRCCAWNFTKCQYFSSATNTLHIIACYYQYCQISMSYLDCYIILRLDQVILPKFNLCKLLHSIQSNTLFPARLKWILQCTSQIENYCIGAPKKTAIQVTVWTSYSAGQALTWSMYLPNILIQFNWIFKSLFLRYEKFVVTVNGIKFFASLFFTFSISACPYYLALFITSLLGRYHVSIILCGIVLLDLYNPSNFNLLLFW